MFKGLISAIGCWMLATTLAHADPPKVDYPALVQACLEEIDESDLTDCVNRSRRPCGDRALFSSRANEHGCLIVFSNVWRGAMHTNFSEALGRAAEYEGNWITGSTHEGMVWGLIDAQRSFESFVEADCEAKAAKYGAGTLRGDATWICEMHHFANRAAELRSWP
ncbi:MAG: hypothetical protein AAGE80_10450 [Pseudomonadota bacterium]